MKEFKSYFSWNRKISKNKAFEIECIYDPSLNFTFCLSSSAKTDHAGVCFIFGLVGYSFSATIYDIRHWDYDYDRYVSN